MTLAVSFNDTFDFVRPLMARSRNMIGIQFQGEQHTMHALRPRIEFAFNVKNGRE